jgi:hypothetical protein
MNEIMSGVVVETIDEIRGAFTGPGEVIPVW